MWVPFYNHPLFNLKDCRKYRDRWLDSETNDTNGYYKLVLSLIENGAGKDFLGHDFFNGNLPILEDCYDLRGFKLWKLNKEFPATEDTFKGIRFDYSEFWHCSFKNVVFYSCSLDFIKCFNCIFDNCAFCFANTVGAKFEKCSFIKCDFAEPSSWENITFINTTFDECFLGPTTPFLDCYFDDLTAVNHMATNSYNYKNVMTPNSAIAGYYSSFQAAYEASGAQEKAIDCFWEGRKSYTRHNLKGWKRYQALFIEAITGYGVKPVRPLLWLMLIYVLASLGFCAVMPVGDSIVFSAGALFTFGAYAERLREFGIVLKIIYVCLSFFGICFTALFVTTIANYWFRTRIPAQTVQARPRLDQK